MHHDFNFIAKRPVKTEETEDSKAYNIWKVRIDASKSKNKDLEQEGIDNRDVYNGNVPKSKDSDVTTNLLYADVKQSIASAYAKNPKIFFTPENPESEKACQVFELITEHLLNKLKFKKTIRAIAKCAKFDAVVATKTYFYYKMNPSGGKVAYNDTVINDEVRTDLVMLKDFFKDAECETYEESPWIGHRIDDSVAGIVEKFKLTEDERKGILANTEKAESNVDGESRLQYQFAEYFEIEDRVRGKIFYFVDGVKRILDEHDKDYSFDSMWDFLDKNHVKGSDDRHSDAYFWRDQRKDYNNFRTMMSEHAYKGSAKIVTRGSDFTDEQENQLISPESKGLVHLKPDQVIDRLAHAPLDPQVTQCFQINQQEIQLISKNISRQSDTEKTATEVKAVEAAAQEVESEDRELLEEMIASIATKWAKLAAAKYDSNRVIRLTGVTDSKYIGFKNALGDSIDKQGDSVYLKYSKQDLDERVQASVKAGSMLPDNEQTRMANFGNFSKFIASVPGAVNALDMEEVINEAVEVFGVKNDNLLKTKDNPFDESKLLNAGVFVAPKMSDDHAMHMEIHQANGNDSPENHLHALIHITMKREQDKVMEMQAAKQMQMGQMQQPMTGASFMGQPQDLNQSPLPAQPNGMGSVMPQGGGGMVPPMPQ